MLRQGCVVRWNWLHYDHAFVVSPNRTAPVTVKTNPCRIEIDYRLSRSDPLYKSYLGMYFRCTLNQFQAYVCDGHARGLPNERPRRGQNARYFFRTGRIRLNRPPAKPVLSAKPRWVSRYPVTEGLIEPFDNSGKLRPGLSFVGRLPSPGCATYPDLEHSTFVFCGAGRSCFVPRLPVHDKELVACPVAPGSRYFTRGRLEALPKA